MLGQSGKQLLPTLADIFEVVRKNRAFVALCIHGVCICTMQYLAENISMYMYSAVYNDVTYKTLASVLSSPFMIGSMIVIPFMCKKLGLMKVIRYSLVIGGGISKEGDYLLNPIREYIKKYDYNKYMPSLGTRCRPSVSQHLSRHP